MCPLGPAIVILITHNSGFSEGLFFCCNGKGVAGNLGEGNRCGLC